MVRTETQRSRSTAGALASTTDCGLKWAPAWALPANLFVLSAALRSVTSLQGLRQPWSGLANCVGQDVTTMWAGAVYLASGRVGGRT